MMPATASAWCANVIEAYRLGSNVDFQLVRFVLSWIDCLLCRFGIKEHGCLLPGEPIVGDIGQPNPASQASWSLEKRQRRRRSCLQLRESARLGLCLLMWCTKSLSWLTFKPIRLQTANQLPKANGQHGRLSSCHVPRKLQSGRSVHAQPRKSTDRTSQGFPPQTSTRGSLSGTQLQNPAG